MTQRQTSHLPFAAWGLAAAAASLTVASAPAYAEETVPTLREQASCAPGQSTQEPASCPSEAASASAPGGHGPTADNIMPVDYRLVPRCIWRTGEARRICTALTDNQGTAPSDADLPKSR